MARTQWRALRIALSLGARAAPLALIGLVSLTVLAASIPVAAAWLTKTLIDRLTVSGVSLADIGAIAAGLMAVGLVAAIQPHLSSNLQSELSREASLIAQDRLYLAVNGYPGLSHFENPASLDRLRLAQQAGQDTPGQILLNALSLGRTTITTAGFFVSLLVIDQLMAWIVLLGAVPALFGELKLTRARVATTLRVNAVERREWFYASLLADVKAAKEVRLFGTGDHLRQRMRADRTTINGLQRRLDRRVLTTQSVLAGLSATVAAFGLLWAVRAATSGEVTIGDVSMFIAAVAAVQSSLAAMAIGIAVVHRHLLVMEHYLAVVDTRSGFEPADSKAVVEPLRHGIELRDVWFRYSPTHPWVLRGVTLTIPFGQSVALVGKNGAGKSTLVKLLCRFYEPTRGEIRWDGVDIREFPVDVLRARISAIFQDFMQYDLTAAENIGLGDLAAGTDPSVIERAAERAGIHHTLSGLPHGYATMLSRAFAGGNADEQPGAGVALSGGQWQRVALARAFIRDRRDLLIMDEPSAGLDAEAEYEIHTRLRTHRMGETTLLISHRLGSVRDADQIVVLRDGTILESGPHEALIAAGTEYARLFAMQSEGYLTQPKAALAADGTAPTCCATPTQCSGGRCAWPSLSYLGRIGKGEE